MLEELSAVRRRVVRVIEVKKVLRVLRDIMVI
jgi:hypothetical protein